MKYELWADKDKTNLSFFGVGESYDLILQTLKNEDPQLKLIWTIEAETYNEAMQKYYDFMGWGKYKPFNE